MVCYLLSIYMYDNSFYSQNNSVRCRYYYKCGNFPKATQLMGELGCENSASQLEMGFAIFLVGPLAVHLHQHPRPSKVTLAVPHFISRDCMSFFHLQF